MLGWRGQCGPGGELVEVGQLVGRGVDQRLDPPACIIIGGGNPGRGRGRDHPGQHGRRPGHGDGLAQQPVGQYTPRLRIIVCLWPAVWVGVVVCREDVQRVVKAGEGPRLHDRRITQLLESRCKHEEAADQVAAVDRRDIPRQERGKGVDVVPVQEMPTVSFEAVKRRERTIDSIDEAGH